MIFIQQAQTALLSFLEVGGPVVAILLVMSVLAGAVFLYKIWQFHAAGVGRHGAINEALSLCDQGQNLPAIRTLASSPNHLAPFLLDVVNATQSHALTPALTSRFEARIEAQLSKLESSFRLLDSIAQLSPLLGLFGTVLGMIEAFQKLQGAGSSVDPSLLAGGIWVALMTTAVGLAVAMPTSILLTWLESRVAAERTLADVALHAVFSPSPALSDMRPVAGLSEQPLNMVFHAGE